MFIVFGAVKDRVGWIGALQLGTASKIVTPQVGIARICLGARHPRQLRDSSMPRSV
jgi:hypothetical protein